MKLKEMEDQQLKQKQERKLKQNKIKSKIRNNHFQPSNQQDSYPEQIEDDM